MKTKQREIIQNEIKLDDCKNERQINGISVKVPIDSVYQDVSYTFTGMTVNNIQYYEIAIFEKAYGRSASSLRRDIDSLDQNNRWQYCVSTGKKQYINEGILLSKNKKHNWWRQIGNAHEISVNKNHVGICGAITEMTASQLKEDAIVPITGVTTNIGVTYIELQAFATKYEMSVSTVRKNLKEIFTKNRWSRERFRYVLTIDGKHYVSPAVLFFNRAYKKKLKNVEYAALFGQWCWDVCGTLRFTRSVNEQKAVWIMGQLFDELQKLYPDVPAYFAYVTEKDPDGFGFHNHFVYGNRDGADPTVLTKQINKIIEPYGGRYDYQTHIAGMKARDYYLEYMVKEIHIRQDGYGFDVC